MRAEAATQPSNETVAPTRLPTTTRRARDEAHGRFEKYGGSRRMTSTKTTRVTVSTTAWVSARSGAPCNAKSSAVA